MIRDLDPPLDLSAAITSLREVAVAQAQAIETLGDGFRLCRLLLPVAALFVFAGACFAMAGAMLFVGVR